MGQAPEWIKAYSYAVLRRYLRQTRRDIDPRELLPPSVVVFDRYISERVLGVIRRLDDGEFACLICGRRFASRRGIYLHLVRKHREELEEYFGKIVREIESLIKMGAI